jgi:nucleoid-associated protein YgaU
MGSETKVGLLVGMCFIVCFAIILAHHGTPAQPPPDGEFEITAQSDQPPQPEPRTGAPATTGDAPPQPPARSDRPARRRDTRTPRRETIESANDERSRRNPRSENREHARYAGRPQASTSQRVADASDRFSRRTAPVPAPGRMQLRQPTESTASNPENFIEGLANALPRPPQSSQPVDPRGARSTAQGNLLDAAEPLLAAGRQMADVLADAGYEISRAAQREQTRSLASVTPQPRARTIPPPAPVESRPAMRPQRHEPPAVNHRIDGQRGEAARTAVMAKHQVQPGDTLTHIARKAYGTDDERVVAALFAANRAWMKSPDRLLVGREVSIPQLNVARITGGQVAGSIGTAASASPGPADALTRHVRRRTGQSAAARPMAAAERAGAEHGPSSRTTATQERTYRIKPGDTLTRIVKKYYRTDDDQVVAAVFDANRDALPSKDSIPAGRKIVLPSLGTASAAAPAVESPDDETASSLENTNDGETGGEVAWRWYELKQGDLYSTVAAEQLGSARRWRELAELNKDIFPDPSRIRWGVKIRIPIERKLAAISSAGGEGRR